MTRWRAMNLNCLRSRPQHLDHWCDLRRIGPIQQLVQTNVRYNRKSGKRSRRTFIAALRITVATNGARPQTWCHILRITTALEAQPKETLSIDGTLLAFHGTDGARACNDPVICPWSSRYFFKPAKVRAPLVLSAGSRLV